MNSNLIILTDRNTGQPVLINIDHIIGAWTVPNREAHTLMLMNAVDGQGRTRELSVTESPVEIYRELKNEQRAATLEAARLELDLYCAQPARKRKKTPTE